MDLLHAPQTPGLAPEGAAWNILTQYLLIRNCEVWQQTGVLYNLQTVAQPCQGKATGRSTSLCIIMLSRSSGHLGDKHSNAMHSLPRGSNENAFFDAGCSN